MNVTQMMDTLAIDPLVLGNVVKDFQEKQTEEPLQRLFHSAVIHKSSLYIYGGLLVQAPEQNYSEQSIVYRYNFSSRGWTKFPTHFLNNNSFSYIYAHSTVIFNNMMYLFGGKNYKTNTYISGLWCLNLQSYNWKRQQLKGYSPIPREHAAMVLHQRGSIVLYGGRNGKENLNDFHIYRIDNKVWIQIEQSSYDLKIPCRLKPAFCSQSDYLYIFGGERMVTHESGTTNILLNDFYQLKLISRPMSTRPDLWIKEIITNYCPPERAATFINVGQRFLMLWGGNNRMKGHSLNGSGFWLYSIVEINWIWVALQSSVDRFPNYGCSINYGSERCFIFGQYSQIKRSSEGKEQQIQIQEVQCVQINTKLPHKNTSGLIVLNLELKEIENKLSDTRFKPKILDLSESQCWECNEQAKSLGQQKFSQFSILQEMLEDNLSYVYSAFGLLIDNSMKLGAKETRVLFNHTFKEKYCLIEDNGSTHKLWTTNLDFINDLLVMRTYVEENIDQLQQEEKEEEGTKKNYIPAQTINSPLHPPIHPSNSILNKETREQKELKEKQARDKQMEKELKKRKRIAKQNFKKRKEDRVEYSRNIKLGSLRIGDRVIFISRYGAAFDNRRVFVIEKAETSSLQSSYKVRAYYYIVENGALLDPNMDNAKRYIDEEYKAYFKIVNDRKEMANNFVFITSLREMTNENGQLEPELKESTRHNDIFCCDRKQFQTLEDGILSDSIDISLKNYLSLLYLKSDEMKISLSISDHQTTEINNSEIFDKIDLLVKSDRLIDLMQALDLSNTNIIEVYYNKTSGRARQLNRKTTGFNFLNGVLFYHKNRLISRYKFNLGEVNKLFKNKLKAIQQILMMFGFIQIKNEFAVNIFKTGFVRDDLLEEIYHRLKFVQRYAQKFAKEGKEETGRRPPQEKSQPRKRFKPNEQGRDQAVNNNQVLQID